MGALDNWEKGAVVILEPKSHKAKNRVRNHKPPFFIIDATMKVQFDHKGGPWILVGTPNTPLWWVHTQDDPNFKVRRNNEEVCQEETSVQPDRP
jgi:hypothetical protein